MDPLSGYDAWKTSPPDLYERTAECRECRQPLPVDDDGEVMPCQVCETCRHCGDLLDSMTRRAQKDAPACRECPDCIAELAAEWTPVSLAELLAQAAALRRFGYGELDAPLADVLAALRRAA